jgi:hypothetical protein
VSALGHYFEEEGLATTGISLIRLHTEKIKPPRALWVPFELGRPLGVPDDPAFQKKVILAALKLLELPSGPVIADYPEDAPVLPEEPGGLACPWTPPQNDTNLSETDRLVRYFRAEMTSLRPWYDMGIARSKRTTVGVSKLDLESLPNFIAAFLNEGMPSNPRDDATLASELRYAADDLRAYYFEAATAQPGMENVTSTGLADWFWKETSAGKVLRAVKQTCLKAGDESLQRVARGQIVPAKFAGLV